MYLLPFILSVAGITLALLSRDRDCIDFAFINVGGVSVIYALDKIQGGDPRWILWNAIAILVSIDVMNRVNRFFGLPNNRRERREAKLMRELFGEETLWNLLIHDPRRKTWRMKP